MTAPRRSPPSAPPEAVHGAGAAAGGSLRQGELALGAGEETGAKREELRSAKGGRGREAREGARPRPPAPAASAPAAPAAPAVRPAPEGAEAWTVSSLAAAVRGALEENFPRVVVRGEVARPVRAASGHAYFTLADSAASLDAVMWRAVAARFFPLLAEGTEVEATGRVSAYAARSRYQLVVEHVALAGAGALLAQREALRRRLAAEGLFDPARKRALAPYPRTAAVITSPGGAVIQDIRHRLSARWPLRLLLWPVRVQGEQAAGEIAAALDGLVRLPPGLPRPEAVIIARGGGSLEDLEPFNDEGLVRAVAACPLPVISAVGHESDETLCDHAADLRAPTPTAAAEFLAPERSAVLEAVAGDARRAARALAARSQLARAQARAAAGRLGPPARLLEEPRRRGDEAGLRARAGWQHSAAARRGALVAASARLLHPRAQAARRRERLEAAAARFPPPARAASRAKGRMEEAGRRLERALAVARGRRRAELDARAALLESLSHRAVLARGFAVARGPGGAVVRRAAELPPGAPFSLLLKEGTLAARSEGEGKDSPAGLASPAGGSKKKA